MWWLFHSPLKSLAKRVKMACLVSEVKKAERQKKEVDMSVCVRVSVCVSVIYIYKREREHKNAGKS